MLATAKPVPITVLYTLKRSACSSQHMCATCSTGGMLLYKCFEFVLRSSDQLSDLLPVPPNLKCRHRCYPARGSNALQTHTRLHDDRGPESSLMVQKICYAGCRASQVVPHLILINVDFHKYCRRKIGTVLIKLWCYHAARATPRGCKIHYNLHGTKNVGQSPIQSSL